MREVKFPLAHTDGLEAVAVIIGEGLAGGDLAFLEHRQERDAVDFILRRRGFGRGQEGRDDVDVGGQSVRLASGFHDAGPADDEGNADTAFEGRTLAFAERTSGAGMTAEVEPRPVVAREDDDRLLLDLLLPQGAHDRTDGVIKVGQGIGVRRGMLALELQGSAKRRVGHGGR